MNGTIPAGKRKRKQPPPASEKLPKPYNPPALERYPLRGFSHALRPSHAARRTGIFPRPGKRHTSPPTPPRIPPGVTRARCRGGLFVRYALKGSRTPQDGLFLLGISQHTPATKTPPRAFCGLSVGIRSAFQRPQRRKTEPERVPAGAAQPGRGEKWGVFRAVFGRFSWNFP